jgi:hypothetical protein
MEREFVSGRWVCRKFMIGEKTLRKIVETCGDELSGVVKIPGTTRRRFLRSKIEAVLNGKAKPSCAKGTV